MSIFIVGKGALLAMLALYDVVFEVTDPSELLFLRFGKALLGIRPISTAPEGERAMLLFVL